MSACEQCPWLSKAKRDLDVILNTPGVQQAAMDGKFFCCHVRMGECSGVKVWARKQRAQQQQKTKT